MNKDNQQKEVFPYKILRKPSPLPFLAAGIAFLLYGILRPIASVMSYVIGAGIAVLVYFIGKGIWPAKKERVELPPDTGDINTDQLLTDARQDLVAIRTSNDLIADPNISATIDSIETTCAQILQRLQEQTDLYSQLRTFLRYYLPTTRKLLDSRAGIEKSGSTGANAQQVIDRTDRVLPEIERAFKKQLEALDKHKYLDIQVEMDVLEGMLKSDGLSDNGSTPSDTTQSQQ